MNFNNSASEKYLIEGENSEERNDSNFQEEGDYLINQMPKYKYEIKVIHPSPIRIRKTKTPDKIMPLSRFTIISNHNNNNSIDNNNKIYFKNNINQLHKNKLMKNFHTIRFYSGNHDYQRYDRNNIYEKNLKHRKIYKKYKNKKYDNSLDSENNMHNDYNCDYIIEIFPGDKCICQEEIISIINEYFHNKNNKYNYKCYRHNMNYMKNNKGKIQKIINNYPNINSLKENKFFRSPIIIQKLNKNLNPPTQGNYKKNKNIVNNK